MKFIYLHEEEAVYLVNTAYIQAISRMKGDEFTIVFVDSEDECLKELWVKELPESILKMIETNES